MAYGESDGQKPRFRLAPVLRVRCGVTEKREDPVGDGLRLLLLHPMAGALHEMAPVELGAGPRAHLLQRAGCLKWTPVSRPGNERRGNGDALSHEPPEVACEAPVHAAYVDGPQLAR